MSMIGIGAFAHDYEVVNEDGKTIYYNRIGSDQLSVTYEGASPNLSDDYVGSITIPETVVISGVTYRVVSIGEKAFLQDYYLTDVSIPNTVTSIGLKAFENCGLKSINLPNSLKTIQEYAFSYCVSLTDVIMPNSVTYIGNHAFFNCHSLERINISNSLTSIQDCTFCACEKLSNVILPDDLMSIGKQAFSGCNLGNITIPKSVWFIDYSAFLYNPLTSIIVDRENTTYDSREDCKAIIETATNKLLLGCSNTTIPLTVTEIVSGAFTKNPFLTSLTIPNSVTSIGQSAFYGDVEDLEFEATEPIALTAQIIRPKSTVIYVPQSALEAYRSADVWNDVRLNIIAKEAQHEFTVETPVLSTIGPNQFENVVSLKLSGNVSSEDVMYIRNKMYNLQHLDLTDAVFVESTVEYASGKKIHAGQCGGFYSLSNLHSVKLPTSTSTIEAGAFAACSYLRNVTVPIGVLELGSTVFSNCGQLEVVELPEGLTTIGSSAFNYCDALMSIILPEGLKTIGYGAFQGCSRLKSVAFPSTLETINTKAFNSCNQLTSVSLPTSLKSIGDYAFQNCTALEELRIPSSVETIGIQAFSSCSKLNDIYTYTVLPTVINSNTFSTYTTATLHAPKQGFTNYYSNPQWGQFPFFEEFDEPYTYFYLNDDLTLDDTTGRIEGEGDDNPDADVNPGGGLIVEGDDDQNLDDLHIHEGDDTGGSVIGDGNINANQLYIDIDIKKNMWYFFAFPYQIALADIRLSCEASYTFRQYDGEERANNGYGGWKHMPEATEYLTANQGYIFRSSENCTLSIPVAKSEFGKFLGGERSQDLATHATTKGAENASWNFIGNPYTCYYDIDEMLNGANSFTGPIVVWNVSTQSYETVRPCDDEYFLRPFEAYFVQKPEGQAAMGYESVGRATYQQSENLKAAKQARLRARGTAGRSRHLVNLVLTDGVTTDKTRVVYNDQCSAEYEIGTDAAKFAAAGVPQLYSLDQRRVQYSINERPSGDVSLGYTAPSAGELTIGTTRMDKPVVLRDNVTGTTHDLQTGGYTFRTEAGTFEGRFTLMAGGSATKVGAVEASASATPDVYTMDGRQVGEPQHGQVNIIDRKKVIK